MSRDVVRGSIPEKLMYICAKPMTLRDGGEGLNAGCEGQTVTPAFVTDATNEKTKKTGYEWARRMSGNYRYGSDRDSNFEPLYMPRKNNPITELKVVELERRAQGGRAYKVIHRGGYLVDMREDVLMDVIFNAGIDEGGVLRGEFIWARHGSEMKLVRVGSELHKSLIEATERKKEKKISIKDLVVGGIYETAGGKKSVYLGKIDCEEAHCFRMRNNYSSNRFNASLNSGNDCSTKYSIRVKGKNVLGFCQIPQYSKNDDDLKGYNIELSKSHSYVRKVGDFEGDPFESLHNDGKDNSTLYGSGQYKNSYGKYYGECAGFKSMSIRPTGEPLPLFIEQDYPDFFEEVVKKWHPIYKK